MTIFNLRAAPAVAIVGKPVDLSPVGSPAGPNNTPRYYIVSAPGDSKLNNLATRVVNNISLEDCRLKTTPRGATFTPDAVGIFSLRIVNVMASPFVPSWDGETGADSDDELTGALSYDIDLRVVEKASTIIGVAPDTGTLTIYGYDNQVLSLAEALALGVKRVELVAAPSSPKARIALISDDVLQLLDLIATSTAVKSQLMMRPDQVTTLIQKWNAHLVADTGWDTHTAADATNTIVLSAPSTLPQALTLLNDIKTKYAAHRVLLSSHNLADATNVVTAANATTLATGIALWIDLWAVLNAHMVNDVVHDGSAEAIIDGAANEMIEAPRTEAGLIAKTTILRTLYREHIAKQANAAPHAAADEENLVLPVTDTHDGLIASVNQLAASMNRHAANRNADGSPAASPYHEASGDPVSQQIVIPQGASNFSSALLVAGLCLIAYETHALSTSASAGTGVHGARAWGKTTGPAARIDDKWGVRLLKAWNIITRTFDPPTIPNANQGFTELKLLGGWT